MLGVALPWRPFYLCAIMHQNKTLCNIFAGAKSGAKMSVILRLNKLRTKANGAMPVVADVSYKRLKKKIYLRVDVQNESRWDARRQNIRNPKGLEKMQYQHLENEKARLNELFMLAKMKDLSAAEFLVQLKKPVSDEKSIGHYFDLLMKAAKNRGAESMVRLFKVGKSVWLDVVPDLPASEISKVHVAEFVAKCIQKNVSSNSIHQYANLMLAALKRAKEDGLPVNLDVFKNQLPKLVKNRRAAYTDKELQVLFTADLRDGAHLAVMYMKCSLYSCGCDISDLLRIPPEQYQRGVVNFKRNKTGVPIKFPVHPWVQEFILNDAIYQEVQAKQLQRKVMAWAMRYLYKGIVSAGPITGIENLILKRARHTWATIAKRKGVSKDVIGEALGHKGSSMTDVYLGAYTMDHLEHAHEMVINHIEAIIQQI